MKTSIKENDTLRSFLNNKSDDLPFDANITNKALFEYLLQKEISKDDVFLLKQWFLFNEKMHTYENWEEDKQYIILIKNIIKKNNFCLRFS